MLMDLIDLNLIPGTDKKAYARDSTKKMKLSGIYRGQIHLEPLEKRHLRHSCQSHTFVAKKLSLNAIKRIIHWN